ncbi:MAG: PDZ domain-containing protein [Planctomycetaceae bacterium]|nr:MAG: PDZ domain-containing protein [Planctomycetaceae bacterium]
MRRIASTVLPFLTLLLAVTSSGQAQTRREKILDDRSKVVAEGFWIYNDLPEGLAQAKKSGLPLLVALRCLPCEECVKLDEELIERHPEVGPLLAKFVRVRLVATNNLDLSLFQFDTDQSFAVFFLNAQGTIYGRFGTRSDQIQWADDVSIEGLARAMEGALELHANYPANRDQLAPKRGPRPEFAVPEDYPLWKGKYSARLNYEGNVERSCIHCHMIGDAARQLARDRDGQLPDELLFPYPHPRALGLVLDPRERSRVVRTEPDSPAFHAGLTAGDDLLTLGGQPLLSIADVQWVLHRTSGAGGPVRAEIRRDGVVREVEWNLPPGWRQRDDIAWRASSWALRRMALGGLYLKQLDEDRRKELNLPSDRQGLYVEHVGLYAPHDQAHKAGFQKGDLLVSFDGKSDFLRETDLIAYALNQIPVERSVTVQVLRGGEPRELRLKMVR